MNLSFGEYQALAAKALRGVGYSWGVTEDGAFALRQLAQQGFSTGKMLTRLLVYVDSHDVAAMIPNEDWVCTGDALCPLGVGTTIADRAGCNSLSLGAVVEPVLVAPFLASTLGSRPNDHYVLSWAGSRCLVTGEGIWLAGMTPSGPVNTTITRTAAEVPSTSQHKKVDRVEIDDETMSEILHFAHRTYAPATEASRLSGAGAGLVDDD